MTRLVTTGRLMTLVAFLSLAGGMTLGGPGDVKLLHAQPFVSDTPISFWIDGTQRGVTEGYVLVVGVDPELVRPINAAEPKLLAGKAVVRRLNVGYPSGRLVVITPGADLAATDLWFSEGILISNLDSQLLQNQRAARSHGPLGAAAARDATVAGGADPLVVRDMSELYREAADLIVRYIPQEADRAAQFR